MAAMPMPPDQHPRQISIPTGHAWPEDRPFRPAPRRPAIRWGPAAR
jgi:hypothetical protein